MKKNVLVFISDEFADWEIGYICAALNSNDSEYVIKTIALNKEEKISIGGLRVLPDYSIEDYPKDYCLLILAGGFGWSRNENNEVLPLVKETIKRKIPLGAICDAVTFLAKNEFLNNIKHSGNSLEYIKSQSPAYKGDNLYVEKQAVCDSNIITANGSAALEFCKEILSLLKAKPEEEILSEYLLHKNGYYSE